MNTKYVPDELKQFFVKNPKVAIAFSGGCDSSYLFYAAVNCDADVAVYFFSSQFQPEHECHDALRTALQLGRPLKVIEGDSLADKRIAANDQDRCYWCKRLVFSKIIERAKADGYDLVIDGTNASDDPDDRPGMRALPELGIRSPLREAGLLKPDIRRLSHEAGLWTWNIATYSCLATRCEPGVPITEALLKRTDNCESIIEKFGFTDFRIRTRGNGAVLEVPREQRNLLEQNKRDIEEILLGQYDSVTYAQRRPPQ
ncbi:conserved hypothetical protein TIGR00268 [Thermoplasmatales archaeon BRNA1]|nr:conserved hypothetical protein TIGR00268 [Thermoplasmatales archaeon BRNA1]